MDEIRSLFFTKYNEINGEITAQNFPANKQIP